MLIGTYKGKTVQCFSIGGKDYCVRRGRVFVHQAALEAAAGMERGDYI